MSDQPATTTADIAVRDGVGFRRRKKLRFRLTRKRTPGEKGEATYHGGKSMLRAWFGKGLLRRKVKGKKNGGAVSEYVGHKRRRYVLTKKGGGKYTIRRKK